MATQRFEGESVSLSTAASSLTVLIQPGYIVLDIPPDELENPDERYFMMAAEEPQAAALQAAFRSLSTRDCRFRPTYRAYSYDYSDVRVLEVDGPSAYIASVVAEARKLGLKNLRA